MDAVCESPSRRYKHERDIRHGLAYYRTDGGRGSKRSNIYIPDLASIMISSAEIRPLRSSGMSGIWAAVG